MFWSNISSDEFDNQLKENFLCWKAFFREEFTEISIWMFNILIQQRCVRRFEKYLQTAKFHLSDQKVHELCKKVYSSVRKERNLLFVN